MLSSKRNEPRHRCRLTRAEPIALPLPEDRGEAALEQTLKRLGTTASLLMIVAHPDDEDGALLTYLSRGLGVRATLFTLTRGEGGQNAMSADSYDALGIIRTNELLKADEYLRRKAAMGHRGGLRILEDAGRSRLRAGVTTAFSMTRCWRCGAVRPQIIVSTFVGGITDGHGQHQVSGEIAQEVFKAAADPKVFPEQLKNGLEPWQPLAVYSMTPFAPVTEKGMFDYATGKWAPAKFHNYVTGEWITGVPSTDVTLPVGTRDLDAGPQLCADCARGLGRAEVAVWRRQSRRSAGREHELSSVGVAAAAKRRARKAER